MIETTYTVRINGLTVGEPTDSLEEAIRRWDERASRTDGATGGITVDTVHNGMVIREGWILHVRDNYTYLNPNLTDTGHLG